MDVAITELEKIDAERVDGVLAPASGIPILLMKATAPEVAKGARDCPKCEKSYDADHKGAKCENCGTDLPDAPAAKASDDDKTDCPTCKGDGKIMGGKRDCPDCDATGKVTPAKAKQLAAKAIARAVRVAKFPDGMAKAIGADGKVDEGPDVELGNKILALIGDAIAAEAQEMAAGQSGEACDIIELAYAAQAIRAWRDGEQAVELGDVMPASMLAQSASKALDAEATRDWTTEQVKEFVAGLVAKSGPSKAERDQAAAEGNALSDGSYPIRNERELHAAAILAQSGHGDVDAAKKLITRRAKELGVANPLDDDKDDAAKGQIAEGGTDVDTVTKGTGDLAKAVEDAVTKAVRPLEERIKTLDAELAKVKATPVPGGPVLSRNVQVKQPGAVVREDWAAKAAYYRDMAEQVTDRETADGYRKMARDADAKAVTPATT